MSGATSGEVPSVIRLEAGVALPVAGPASAVTVGTFDGVHLGHRAVLARLRAIADARGLQAVVVTFDPHPIAVIRPGSEPPLLTTVAEKCDLLLAAGADRVVLVPFTAALSALDAEAFLDDVLRARVRAEALLVGHDHGFGRDRTGTAATLPALGAARGLSVEVADAVMVAGPQGSGPTPVSSSRIRTAVSAGQVGEAATWLGRAYAVRGTVVPGAGRGRDLGARTLNLALPDPRKLLPADGVYAVRTRIGDVWYDGMANLGARPTFDETERRLEVHCFEPVGDRYGAEVDVAFVARLRGVRRFPDAAALAAQLGEDAAAARSALDVSRLGRATVR